MLRSTLAVVFIVPAALERTVVVRAVLVPDRREEVEFRLGQEQRRGEGVHGRVAPALVVEAALCIEELEVGLVGRRAPEVKVGNLEVGPDW
jgi:hypothetical protein